MCFAGLIGEPFHFQRHVKCEILQLSGVFLPSHTSKMSLQKFSSSLSLESYLRDSTLKPSKPTALPFFSFEIAFFTSRWVRGSWFIEVRGSFEYMWVLGWSMDIGMAGRSCFTKCCSRCFLGFSYSTFSSAPPHTRSGTVLPCVCCRLRSCAGRRASCRRRF